MSILTKYKIKCLFTHCHITLGQLIYAFTPVLIVKLKGGPQLNSEHKYANVTHSIPSPPSFAGT